MRNLGRRRTRGPSKSIAYLDWNGPYTTLTAAAAVIAALGCSAEDSPTPGTGQPIRPTDSQHGYYVINGTLQAVAYVTSGDHRVFEGDIVLDADEEVSSHNAALALGQRNPEPGEDGTVATPLHTIPDARRWPKGVVPYVLDQSLPRAGELLAAMDHVERQTPIRFVERTDEKAYLKMVRLSQEEMDRGYACKAHVGYRPGRVRKLWLGPKCNFRSTVHELGHIIGLWHEHTRADRDDYILVDWDNIRPGIKGAYVKIQGNPLYRVSGQYNVLSVMHYSSYGSAIDRSRPVLVRKSDGSTWPYDGNSGLSALDAQGIAKLYEGEAGGKNNGGGGTKPSNGECNDTFYKCRDEWGHDWATEEFCRSQYCAGGPYFFGSSGGNNNGGNNNGGNNNGGNNNGGNNNGGNNNGGNNNGGNNNGGSEVDCNDTYYECRDDWGHDWSTEEFCRSQYCEGGPYY